MISAPTRFADVAGKTGVMLYFSGVSSCITPMK
jgi:hypothetical protein